MCSGDNSSLTLSDLTKTLPLRQCLAGSFMSSTGKGNSPPDLNGA